MFATRILWKSAKKGSKGSKGNNNVVKDILKPSTKPTFLIVSAIGNPEKVYGGTRHNVGKLALQMTNLMFFNHPKLSGILYALDMDRPNMLFLQTEQYMNQSGLVLKPALKFFSHLKRERYNVKYVVVHDEMSKDLGKVQLREGNTSVRGHNGLKDIVKHCNVDFFRLGIGIGRPESRDPFDVTEHVLGVTTRYEREIIRDEATPKMMKILDDLVKTKFPENRDLVGGHIEIKPPIQGDERLRFQDPDPHAVKKQHTKEWLEENDPLKDIK